jgi:hypothetical protein
VSKEEQQKSALEQVHAMRDLSRITGALSDVQILNLKMWALLAAPHADRAEVTWDCATKDIDIELKLAKKKKEPPEFDNLLGGLDRSIKDLLGHDWLVRVRVRNKVVFRGPRIEAPKVVKPEPTGEFDRGEMQYDARLNPARRTK